MLDQNFLNVIKGGAVLIAVLTIWDLFWRGKALWKSARNNQNYWFIALLIVNSVGILPIIYLLFFQGKKK
jgi:hypothetical protein